MIEEHFYVNPNKINFSVNNRDLCFDAFSVAAGQTLDFSANVSIAGWPGSNAKNLARLFLAKNKNSSSRGDRVAQNWFSSNGRWTSPSGSLIYREKLDSDATYTLCFTFQDKIDPQPYFSEGMFQWGYKVLGSGYEMIEHTFDTTDMILENSDPVWHL